MILLLLIFIAAILLFGAAAVKAGLTKGFFALVTILAISGIIVSLSGDIDKGEALPIFLGVSTVFIVIIALVCFVGLKILMKPSKSEENIAKDNKWKKIALHVFLWCGTVVSLVLGVDLIAHNYYFGVYEGIVFFISAILLCPIVTFILIKQEKFRKVTILSGIVVFALHFFLIQSGVYFDLYYNTDGYVEYRQSLVAQQVEKVFSNYELNANATVTDRLCDKVTVECSDMENYSNEDLIILGKALQDYDEFSLECSVVSGENTYMFVTDYPDKLTITKNGELIYPQERETLQNATSSNDNKSGEYWCMGKNDTCQNKTTSPDDFFCDECDPDGDNIEG